MFYDIFTNLCSKKGMSPTAVLQKLKISTSKSTAWKNGSLPNASILILLSEFFGVSIDYLLMGKENFNNNNISNSTIGAVGTYSKGTVTLSEKTEPKSDVDNVAENRLSENEEELLRIFKSLPKRERVKLLNMVYEFEEDYRNKSE